MIRTLVLIQSEGGAWTIIDGDRMTGQLQSDEALGMVAIALMTGRRGYPLTSFEECERALFDRRHRHAQWPDAPAPTENGAA